MKYQAKVAGSYGGDKYEEQTLQRASTASYGLVIH